MEYKLKRRQQMNENAKEMEYNGYSSHDAETHYTCPNCGKDYGGWSFVNGAVNVTDHKFRCECGTLLKVPR
jgi:DNA-directed RNA polymerase subunit RPC12/RpoP